MRKTLSTIVLAGAVVLGGTALAHAEQSPRLPNDCPEAGALTEPCMPAAWVDDLNQTLNSYEATIADQQLRLDHKTEVIKRLRHKLSVR